MIVIDNDGDAIFLIKENIKIIKNVKKNTHFVYFSIQFIDNSETDFKFVYNKYNTDKDTLFIKVCAMRLELVKKINGGVEVENMFQLIDLKKKKKVFLVE